MSVDGKNDLSASETTHFRVRSKVWIEDADGKVIFGLGRYKMLDAVQRLGSLKAAAKELKMSYRAIWCRIKATEERMNTPLLVRDSSGSMLTARAKNLMERYRRLQTLVEDESNQIYDDVRPTDPHR